MELVEAELPDQRRDLLAGIGAHHLPHFQQHARALDDLGARLAKLQRVGNVTGDREAEEKAAGQNEAEAKFDTHGARPSRVLTSEPLRDVQELQL